MKSNVALAALLGIVFAGASVSGAFAQSGPPGTTPSKPNKVAAVPPPPPPGGPDKLVTRTRPATPDSGLGKPRDPAVVDDVAGGPNVLPSSCYPAAGPNCVASLDKLCTKRGGGMSTNPDGSVTCTVND
jgi:hypothetical protein